MQEVTCENEHSKHLLANVLCGHFPDNKQTQSLTFFTLHRVVFPVVYFLGGLSSCVVIVSCPKHIQDLWGKRQPYLSWSTAASPFPSEHCVLGMDSASESPSSGQCHQAYPLKDLPTLKTSELNSDSPSQSLHISAKVGNPKSCEGRGTTGRTCVKYILPLQ